MRSLDWQLNERLDDICGATASLVICQFASDAVGDSFMAAFNRDGKEQSRTGVSALASHRYMRDVAVIDGREPKLRSPLKSLCFCWTCVLVWSSSNGAYHLRCIICTPAKGLLLL